MFETRLISRLVDNAFFIIFMVSTIDILFKIYQKKKIKNINDKFIMRNKDSTCQTKISGTTAFKKKQ